MGCEATSWGHHMPVKNEWLEQIPEEQNQFRAEQRNQLMAIEEWMNIKERPHSNVICTFFHAT